MVFLTFLSTVVFVVCEKKDKPGLPAHAITVHASPHRKCRKRNLRTAAVDNAKHNWRETSQDRKL
jgi:hypothetical protein